MYCLLTLKAWLSKHHQNFCFTIKLHTSACNVQVNHRFALYSSRWNQNVQPSYISFGNAGYMTQCKRDLEQRFNLEDLQTYIVSSNAVYLWEDSYSICLSKMFAMSSSVYATTKECSSSTDPNTGYVNSLNAIA